MSKFWSDFVRELKPYVPGEQPKDGQYIKLNTNESPFDPSPVVIDAIRQEVEENLRLYPDPESDKLREAIGSYYDIPADFVFPGNGSDEVLAHLFYALFRHRGKKVLFPDITYSFYRVYAKLYDLDFEAVALNSQFEIDINDYINVSSEDVCGIIFPNPNAPTGIAVSLEKIEELLQAQPDIVVAIDEAYVDFGADSAVRLLEKYDNLIVLQTLSKSRSLAGLRVGFAMAQPHLLQALVRVKNSFNSYPLDRLAQVGAIAAFEDDAYFEQTRQEIISSREFVSQELAGLGFVVLPSKTNFVFVSHPRIDAAVLSAQLRQHLVLVRHFDQNRISQYLRITIGTRKQCEVLIKTLSEILTSTNIGSE
ncbi:histidinol-phosphate aminotransferase [Advenella faeciporci]|uniref:Histidinol-phosphate aminotransferase n=1 Tax=Advenella faeciporci TaxID=797535 RepID=A0A918JD88_9BURK|nr:histidinol-phosphate transaminase [Advenella faeciporci]GGW74880.1 histidinol-phosphate aminotransferase [Advenella faeciporci]